MNSLSIRNYVSFSSIGWLATAMLASSVSGCSTEPTGNEDPGVATIAILGQAGDNADEPDLGRLRGTGLGLIDGMPGIALKCDAEPAVTLASVCGTEQPSSERYAWSDCQLGMGGQGRGKGSGGPISSGSIEISHEMLGASAGCDATTPLELKDVTVLDIERVMPNGRQMTMSGTVTSTSAHSLDATTFSKAVAIDARRSMSDGDGSLLKDVTIAGTATVVFSVDAAGPLRVIDGNLGASFGEGDASSITLAGVTRRDVTQCRWPIAGTLTRIEADGTAHELVFSSTCGQANLDGASVDLNAQRGHGMRGKGNGKGNCSM